MAESRAMGIFSRLQLYSRDWNGADSMIVWDMVSWRPHYVARVHRPSSGVIGIGTSCYLGNKILRQPLLSIKLGSCHFCKFAVPKNTTELARPVTTSLDQEETQIT